MDIKCTSCDHFMHEDYMHDETTCKGCEIDALRARVAELEAEKAELEKVIADTKEKMLDPSVVYVNMLRGFIAKPSFSHIAGLYPEMVELEKDRERAQTDNISLMQYENLRQHFGSLIQSVLGSNYYNMGMDVYECDRLSCEDIAAKANETWFQRLLASMRKAIDAARKEAE